MNRVLFRLFPTILFAVGLAERTLEPTASAGDPIGQLRVCQANYPRAFFFRRSEGQAANPRIDYERWEGAFSQLMGIEGKVLDEEIPGRSRRNVGFFTRFKHQHPDQLVLLHFNGNSRDPRYETEEYFAGHWIYHNGARILGDVAAKTGETDIRVDDTRLFRMSMGRYLDKNEDVGLCMLDEKGWPDWSRSEQVQLVSIDDQRGVIRVRRGCFGTRPRSFPAGKAYAAAHVTGGPWGRKSNLLWRYNWSTRCPTDAAGRTCADVLVEELVKRFGPGGQLAAFDGIEFDVLNHRAGGRPRGRGPDCDADGQIDNGVFDGLNTYGIGVVEFCRQLQERIAGSKLVLADGRTPHNQRAFRILNGIESEGWPGQNDWEINDWSGGLNRHWFWQENSRAPVLNYFNHKYTMAGEEPGQRIRPKVPFSTHRLVMAAAQFTDAAFCYSFVPPAAEGELIGVWDELWKGVEHEPGWLGKPLGPAVRIAKTTRDLLDGRGKALSGAWLSRWRGGDARFAIEGDDLHVSGTDPEQRELRFRLNHVPCDGPDLFVSVTLRGEPRADYPPEIARPTWLGIAESRSRLVTEDLPDVGMCIRGQKETELKPETGAAVRFIEAQGLGGEKHDAYFVHPPYRGGVGYTFWERQVQVPADGRIEFFLGMGERAPSRSDGVTFKVLAAESADGRSAPFKALFEAIQVESRWTAHSVSLAEWAGKSVRLRFVSDCGPKHDSTTDHSYWGDVRLIDPTGPHVETEPVRYMTWTNDKPFTSGFYFSQVKTDTIDLEFRIEGTESVWVSGLTVHAHPDAIYRAFENGLVLANPSPRGYAFNLDRLFPGQSFRRLEGSSQQDRATNDGSRVTGEVVLKGKDGLFLSRIP